MRSKEKVIELDMDLYNKLLEYSIKNELKAPSASQGDHVKATILLLSKALPEK
jgi:hypothetical protein